MSKQVRWVVISVLAALALPTTAHAVTDTVIAPYASAEAFADEGYEMLGDRSDVSASASADVSGVVSLSSAVTTEPLGGLVPLVRAPSASADGTVTANHAVSAGVETLTYTVHLDVDELSASGRPGPIVVDGYAYAELYAYAWCDCDSSGAGFYIGNGDPGLENTTVELELEVTRWFPDTAETIQILVSGYTQAYGGHRRGTYEATADFTISRVDATY